MADNIAPTTFQSGPTDSVAVADVYKAKPTAPVNNGIGDAAKSAASKAADLLKGNLDAKDLADMTTIEDGKASVNKKDSLTKVATVLGGPNGPINDLKESVIDEVLRTVGFKSDKDLAAAASGAGVAGVDGQIKTKKGWQTVSGIKLIVADIQNIRNMDASSATGIAGILNAVSGNSALAKTLDLESQFAVLGKIMNKVSELRIPEAIDAILAKLADDKERQRLLLENLRSSVMQSDMYVIHKAIQYVGGPGVLARVPDFVELLLMFYTFPPGVSKPSLTLMNDMKAILDTVSPGWHLYSRDGTNINNLQPFTLASDDAIANFSLIDRNAFPGIYQSTVFAKQYPSKDLISSVIHDFPGIALDPPSLYR